MKKPSMSPSNSGTADKASFWSGGNAAPESHPTPSVIHFDLSGLNSIGGGLALRSFKRAAASGAVRLSRGFCLVALLAAVNFASAQSLWRADSSRALIADRKAKAVGDLVTILVQESNTATKDNSTSTSKSSGIDASISSFLYSPTASGFLTKGGQMPALKLQSAQNFDGGGKISNSEKITARISVRIMDVLPNNNLVVEGRRTTSFAGETQEAVLRGVIRPDDIAPNNTIYSYNVADATIKYVSSGAVTDNQRKGWFTRIWEKVSPF
jgi:flagellar L-ring protein precursor FlgH